MICVRRNPMDTCLGNFRQLFPLASPYYDYSLDIGDIGRYSPDPAIKHRLLVLEGALSEE